MNSKILFAFLHSTGIVFQPEWKININFTFDIPSDSLAYILIAYILISIDISILIKYFPRQKNSLFLRDMFIHKTLLGSFHEIKHVHVISIEQSAFRSIRITGHCSFVTA